MSTPWESAEWIANEYAKDGKAADLELMILRHMEFHLAKQAAEMERLRRALVATQEAAERGDTDACHELAFQALKKINK